MSIESQLSNVIRKDRDRAYAHVERHVTTQAEILELDSECEYCKIYLLEREIN